MEEDQVQDKIHAVAARIKNHCVETGAQLTPVGIALCNMMAHNLMALYRFQSNLEPDLYDKLNAILNEQEKCVANFLKGQKR